MKIMTDTPIDPDTEYGSYGHNPTPCRARRSDCPSSLHCISCGAAILEGYRPGFTGTRVWTHDTAARAA